MSSITSTKTLHASKHDENPSTLDCENVYLNTAARRLIAGKSTFPYKDLNLRVMKAQMRRFNSAMYLREAREHRAMFLLQSLAPYRARAQTPTDKCNLPLQWQWEYETHASSSDETSVLHISSSNITRFSARRT